MEILFLMMQPGHDRAATQQVRQAMEEPSYLLEESCTPQELMAVLGKAELCVAIAPAHPDFCRPDGGALPWAGV